MALFYIVSTLTIVAVFEFYIIGTSNGAAIANDLNYDIEVPVNNNVCTTLACNNSASKILNNIDNTVAPCDNFYRFACGGFSKRNNIPDDKQILNAFIAVEAKVNQQLRSCLEEPSPPNELKAFKLVKNFYKSCMNEVTIEKRGYKPLLKILKKFGGWPVVEDRNWNETNFNWIETTYKFFNAGYPINYFLNLFIATDMKNATKKILKLGQPIQAEMRDIIIKGMNNTYVKAYYKLMVDVAVMLGVPRKRASVELEESLKFEIAIGKITQPKTKLRNSTRLYNPMTVGKLSKRYPSIPWKEYINNIMAPHVTIDNKEIVIVTNPHVISRFIELMSKTPKRVQANYVMWKAVLHTVPYLTQNMQNRWLKYTSEWSGATKLQPRWERCVKKANVLLGTHALYVSKYFDEAAKKKANEIVTDMRNQFNKILETTDWMDNETRKNALDKAAAISTFVAYPNELIDNDKLEKWYEGLELDDNNYLKNGLKIECFIDNHDISNFRKPINKSDWTNHGHVAVVNAFYNQHTNSIDLPAGILQGIFFNNDLPQYMNYGAIASIIGHEIIHGFDDEGRQYDKYGNLRQWWTPYSNEKYIQKAQCIINQYGNYTVDEIGKKLNGINTQGENIGDNGGIKIAYMAYKDWSKRHGKEQTLPGLQFNPQQLFWISAANMYCSKVRPEGLKTLVSNDPHAPEEFRVLGSFSNIQEFAEDFNCPVGTKMNPKDKCTFW